MDNCGLQKVLNMHIFSICHHVKEKEFLNIALLFFHHVIFLVVQLSVWPVRLLPILLHILYVLYIYVIMWAGMCEIILCIDPSYLKSNNINFF